jgi:sugar O-acyltransferase (sialic acid O-acetyltransferase NeuD family)
MKRLIIIGASGHGKVIADIAVLNGYTDIVFLDDHTAVEACAGFPVIGTSLHAPEGDIFIAIGNAAVRKRLAEQYRDRRQPVLIHPNAVVAKDVEIGPGTVVMAGTVINPGATVGRGCIVNTCSSVDHDCTVSDYVHIAVGAHLCGTVTVGENTWIGAGAVISNNIRICKDCMIGAGAVVVKDISVSGKYLGVPAALKKE